MPANENAKLLQLSQRWYQRLLRVYPQSHRAEYGEAMAQLFRDQCRDAWRDARRRGLLLLWLRVLPDLLKTSFLEHLDNLKGKKVMINKISTGGRPASAPWVAFFVVFVPVFALVLLTGTIVTFILPEQYMSASRIKITANPGKGSPQATSTPATGQSEPYLLQTEFEIIHSELILDKVIEQLGLNETWQKKYGAETKFKTSEIRQALRRMVDLRPLRNTSLVAINVYSDDRFEAAKIANSIAQNYQVYREGTRKLELAQVIHEVEQERASHGQPVNTTNEEARIADIIAEVNQRTAEGPVAVTVIETAEPSFRPIRPNKPLNIFISGVLGCFAGLAGGGIAVWVVSRMRPRSGNSPPPVPVVESKY